MTMKESTANYFQYIEWVILWLRNKVFIKAKVELIIVGRAC